MSADGKAYEELRRQRVQENIKHLEDLGIAQISKCLLEVAKTESKLLKRTKPKKMLQLLELRRSSRARNLVPSYRDQVDDVEHRSYRKRYCRSDQPGRAYNGRISSYEEQVQAVQKAEELQNDLDPSYPSFVKTMVRSHVSSCFWLGLPSSFCKEHLPPHELKMVLEDENGSEYDAIYIGNRNGLSGGWRGFAMDHNLEDGDALVFQLIEPDRFKIYIIKAIEEKVDNDKITNVDVEDHTVSQKPVAKAAKKKKKKQAGKRQCK